MTDNEEIECHKVVIRRLPPYLTWEELKEQLDPLPSSEFVSFVPADLSFIPHAFSRCYFAFSDETAAVDFGNKFNRYVFVDKKGYESAAIVELAMFQRVPRKRREDVQKDQRCGIIEQEVEYCRFVDELESSRNCAVLTMENQLRNMSLRKTATKAVEETPLTQFFMHQIEEKIRKAEKKREKKRKYIALPDKEKVPQENPAPVKPNESKKKAPALRRLNADWYILEEEDDKKNKASSGSCRHRWIPASEAHLYDPSISHPSK